MNVRDTILDVFNYTNFEGKVCAWYLEYIPESYDPILTIEFKPDNKMHMIQGVVPADIALEAVEQLTKLGYHMVKIDGSTVQ
jgi:hypothetical protein